RATAGAGRVLPAGGAVEHPGARPAGARPALLRPGPTSALALGAGGSLVCGPAGGGLGDAGGAGRREGSAGGAGGLGAGASEDRGPAVGGGGVPGGVPGAARGWHLEARLPAVR